MKAKVLTVATAVQKAVLEQVILKEISSGFWKNHRPADHADFWKGIEIKISAAELGLSEEAPRNYNFVNPQFFQKSGKQMLEVAQTVAPDITEKGLKKQLLMLNQIVGGRIKEQGGPVTKLSRGRKADPDAPPVPKTTKTTKATTKRVAANIQEPTEEHS